MKNIIKTLIPLATGLVVGVVVGRVKNNHKINDASKKADYALKHAEEALHAKKITTSVADENKKSISALKSEIENLKNVVATEINFLNEQIRKVV